MLVSVGIRPEAEGPKLERISKLGSSEDFVSNERQGTAVSVEAGGLARGGGWRRWLSVAARRRPEADSSFGRFPQGDLVQEEPLVGKLNVRGIGVEASA